MIVVVASRIEVLADLAMKGLAIIIIVAGQDLLIIVVVLVRILVHRVDLLPLLAIGDSLKYKMFFYYEYEK